MMRREKDEDSGGLLKLTSVFWNNHFQIKCDGCPHSLPKTSLISMYFNSMYSLNKKYLTLYKNSFNASRSPTSENMQGKKALKVHRKHTVKAKNYKSRRSLTLFWKGMSVFFFLQVKNYLLSNGTVPFQLDWKTYKSGNGQ